MRSNLYLNFSQHFFQFKLKIMKRLLDFLYLRGNVLFNACYNCTNISKCIKFPKISDYISSHVVLDCGGQGWSA